MGIVYQKISSDGSTVVQFGWAAR